MIKAAALDSSTVRGRSQCHTYTLNHSNVEFRADSLAEHYARAKAAGVEMLRVGAWLQHTNPGYEVFEWDYLDKVAELAKGLPTVLVLYHYDWPVWLTLEQVLNDGGALFGLRAGQQIAKRYPGVFHSYVPMCEVNFQAHMIDCGRWYPNAGGGVTDPGKTWGLLSRMLQSVADGLKWGDPTCLIGTSEPFNPACFDLHARPLDLLAERGCLDIVGVNGYHTHEYPQLHAEAARRWPGKPLWLAEGGNIWAQERHPNEWYEAAEAAGFDAMVYGPALPMLCFDHGHLVGPDLFEALTQVPV